MTMTRDELTKGLAGLNAPDQGRRYFGGGFDHDAPAFDDRTGERLPPVHRTAELTVYGDRARFLYRLIEQSDTALSLLNQARKPEGGGDALRPFALAYDMAFSGFSDGIEVRLDASFDLQDAIGRDRKARCVHKPISLTVGDFHAAKTALNAHPAPEAGEVERLRRLLLNLWSSVYEDTQRSPQALISLGTIQAADEARAALEDKS